MPEAPVKSKSKRKPALTKYTVCITDTEVLAELKEKEREKLEKEQEKITKRQEMEQKKQEREEKKRQIEERKQERRRQMEKRKQEREEKKRQVEERKQEREKRQKGVAVKETRSQSISKQLENLTLSDKSDEDENEATICPKCGKVYGDCTGLWVSCDICNKWYDFKCTNIKSRRAIPDSYVCDACV